MSITARRYTYQDLLDTPDDGRRYEIIDGELYVSASPAKPHVWLSNHWSRWLGNYVEANDLGEVYHAPVDVKFSEENVVVPDIIFIRKDRLHIFGRANVTEAPDAVIEILSPSTRRIDLGKKFELYARMGVPEYWVADPVVPELAIYVLTPQGTYERARPEGRRLRSTVLPDLEIDLAAIFFGMPEPETE
jgi:Uma2 family endonuclease